MRKLNVYTERKHKMSYKLAIFDLDGTLLSTLGDITDSVNHALVQNSMPERTLEEVRSFVGNGVKLLIERAVSENSSAETVDKVLLDYQKYYSEHSAIKTRPYDGIPSMLENIRASGCKTAVLSNKPDAPTSELCKQYFGELVDYAAGEKAGISRKPAPDGVIAILERFSVNAEDAVYIGDSEVDVETAKNAGLDCISVDWGFRDRKVLMANGAKTIVSTARELELKIQKA